LQAADQYPEAVLMIALWTLKVSAWHMLLKSESAEMRLELLRRGGSVMVPSATARGFFLSRMKQSMSCRVVF
jgi:hypothetical protein